MNDGLIARNLSKDREKSSAKFPWNFEEMLKNRFSVLDECH